MDNNIIKDTLDEKNTKDKNVFPNPNILNILYKEKDNQDRYKQNFESNENVQNRTQ